MADASSAAAFDPRTIDNFLNDLEKAIDKGAAEKAAKKKDKEFQGQVDKATSLLKNTTTLLKLLSPFSSKMSADDRQKLLEEALTGLVGGAIGEKGDDLATAVHDLIDIWRGKLTEDEKKKKLEDSIKKLVAMAGTAATGAKDKDVSQLVDAATTLLKLATGSLTDAERQKLLEDNALKLVTSDLIKRQLEWFVSENFMTYFQAVKIGYDLGKPFGDYIAKQLAPIVKARYGEDFLIALESEHPGWFETVTAGHEAVTVTLQGSFNGWRGTAFWDYTVNGVRIQVITPNGNVLLLDGNGVDVTGEKPGAAPQDDSAPQGTGGATTDAAQSNVERAKQIADNDPKVKALKAKMDELHQTAVATETAAAAAQRTGDAQTYNALEIRYRMQFNEYWRVREEWKAAVHQWFLKAAAAEKWGTLELNYLWQKYAMFAIHDGELSMAVPSGFAMPGGVRAMPASVGRAGIYALIGTIVLALAGVVAFAATRGNAPSVAGELTASAAATSSARSSTAPAQASANVICNAAPNISITLSGAATGTATKACEPWVSLAAAQQRPNTPYCRLEGIPNKKNVQAGVYSSQVMFIIDGTKYQLVIQYVADIRNPETNGTLPVTIAIGNGDGILSMSSWPATSEIPSGATSWRAAAGSYSIGADGTTGTIDVDFSSNDGKTLHVKGSWTVAKGCPPVG